MKQNGEEREGEGREYAEIRNEGMDRIMRYNFGMDGYTNNKLLLHRLYHYVITLYTTRPF